jgi:topoisomerase IA-like protein
MGADEKIVNIQRRTVMKKLMTLMLGLAFLTGGVALAQDTTKDTTKTTKSTKKTSTKKTVKKTTDTTKTTAAPASK